MTVPNSNAQQPSDRPAERLLLKLVSSSVNGLTNDMTTNGESPAAHALKTPLNPLNNVTPHDRPLKYLEVQP